MTKKKAAFWQYKSRSLPAIRISSFSMLIFYWIQQLHLIPRFPHFPISSSFLIFSRNGNTPPGLGLIPPLKSGLQVFLPFVASVFSSSGFSRRRLWSDHSVCHSHFHFLAWFSSFFVDFALISPVCVLSFPSSTWFIWKFIILVNVMELPFWWNLLCSVIHLLAICDELFCAFVGGEIWTTE